MRHAVRVATLPWGAVGVLLAFVWLPLVGGSRGAADGWDLAGVEAPAPPVWEAAGATPAAAPFVAPVPARRVRRLARPSPGAAGPAPAPGLLPRHRALRWYGRRLLEGG